MSTATKTRTKRPQALYAFHVYPEGERKGAVGVIGKVVAEFADTLRLEIVDAVMAVGCGVWQLSDEIRDVPKSECRMFKNKLTCLETGLRINNAIYNR